MTRCRKYLGDNDATTPQLTCLRRRGHDGLCDNVLGDDDEVDIGVRRDVDMHVLDLCPVAECAHAVRAIDSDARTGRCHGGHLFRWSPR